MAAIASTLSTCSMVRRLLAVLTFCLVLTQAKAGWPAINKEELADNTPQIDPGADAEILAREVTMNRSSLEGTEDSYYVRAKIFDQRGIERFSLFSIAYDNNASISSISARTIKPDGTVIELSSKDFHDRELIKAGDIRVKAKSFAFPGLETGAIVEFRYTLISSDPSANWFMRLIFQDRLPTRLVKYNLSLPKLPIEITSLYDIRALSYNCPGMALKPDMNGVYHFEMKNLPAIKEEPFEPSPLLTHASMLIYFSSAKDLPPDVFWKKYSKTLQEKLEAKTKVTKVVSTTLAGIVGPDDSAEDKLHKIYDYCRTKIVNRNRASTHFTREQIKGLKINETATDTLKQGNGTSSDINYVFAALAKAAGAEVRLAGCNDRTLVPYNPKVIEPFVMFPNSAIAVKNGDGWRYFDPGATFLPFGTLMPKNTDTVIILSSPKGDSLPMSLDGDPAEISVRERKATFHLSADGTLVGSVTENCTGHCEVTMKHSLESRTPERCAAFIRHWILLHYKQARVSSVVVENNADPIAPIKVSYQLTIPHYADRTGTRLLFQPAVFEKGTKALFETTERTMGIQFPFREINSDEIHLFLPLGFSLEEAAAPGGLDLGALGKYQISVTFNKKTGELVYQRSLSRTGLFFLPTAYAPIKKAYDLVHEEDGYTLSLKSDNPAATTSEPASGKPAPEPAPSDKNAEDEKEN